MSGDYAGHGYLVRPAGSAGPGVLVLHSWWGLTPFFKSVCDRLAAAGYTALAPDLLYGELPDGPEEAEAALARNDVNRTAALMLSSSRALRAASIEPRDPIAVIGWSMGASWALWLSARSPKDIAATVAFYGTQSIDFVESRSAYLGHFAESDEMVSPDDVVEMEAHLRLLELDVAFHQYPGTSHWFFEGDQGTAFDAEAADLAWQRTLDFLKAQIGPPNPAEGTSETA